MVAKKKKSAETEVMSLETIREEILKKSKAGEEISEKAVMIQEVRDKWGASFVVISGGEPYMYRDGDKTILDVYAKFPDMDYRHTTGR